MIPKKDKVTWYKKRIKSRGTKKMIKSRGTKKWIKSRGAKKMRRGWQSLRLRDFKILYRDAMRGYLSRESQGESSGMTR